MSAFIEVVEDTGVRVVERLAREVWIEHFEAMIGLPQVEYMLGLFQSAQAITGQLKQGHKYYLVYVDDVPAGYIAVAIKADQAELFLSKFYLLAAYRGRGIGREMIAFVKDFARRHALKKIILNTNKKNVDTISFYEKAGFLSKVSDVKDIGGGFVTDDWQMSMRV